MLSLPLTAQVTIAWDTASAPVTFGAMHILAALKKAGISTHTTTLTDPDKDGDIIICIHADTLLQKEGYRLGYRQQQLLVTAIDPVGAMYGAMDVAEQLRMGKTWHTITAKTVAAYLSVRAVKFDLPWSPYRPGEVMAQHLLVCRDLAFWQRFMDMMAENHLNVLSLWNVHPFSYMVKPENFPEANDFSPEEMAEWKHFWTALFRMAKDRGIAPFIVNWNIAVSPEFAKHYGVKERNDTSIIVKKYTKEIITQVINEYPDLAGIGITLADWMSNFNVVRDSLPVLTPEYRENWIAETVVAGIKAARRPVQFLHRSVLSADPAKMRSVIDDAALPDTTLVEIKFNMSHGYSTPQLALTHDVQSGRVDDRYWNPLPENFRIQWTVRNEDFFILRWGQPDYIRRHILINTHPYVNGYFIGSEGYIPAKDFSHLPGTHQTWDYAFEKQWLFYLLWGRLLYHPTTPDAVFEAAFSERYGAHTGKVLLPAYAAASNMPVKLASFYAASWDYTLYSEGFLAPFGNGGYNDTVSSFISIDEWIDHPALDPTYLSIRDYVKERLAGKPVANGMLSPLMLADSLEADSRLILNAVKQLQHLPSPVLHCELDDLATWAFLSRYFSHKLRAGVTLATYRLTHDKTQQQKALTWLQECLEDWKQVCVITGRHYKEVAYLDDEPFGGHAFRDAKRFSWVKFLPQVQRDIELAKANSPVIR